RSKDAAENSPVLVIRADTAPYKAAPEDPGGMEIPYRDSTVFETLRSADADDGEKSKVESLLPPPEQPIERAQMFAGLKTEPIEEDAEAEPDIGPTTPDKKASAAPAPIQEMPTPSQGTEIKAAATEPAAGDATAKTMPESGNSGAYYVQLGSLKDRTTADAEWAKLQKQFPSELGGLTLRVQQADLGAKGKFFRIQGGTISKEKAQKICSSISGKRAGGCLVVAR
ncbi:MAG TPA: SPOR domain-containing protein, partial [Alphaproteobacteria bacterium]